MHTIRHKLIKESNILSANFININYRANTSRILLQELESTTKVNTVQHQLDIINIIAPYGRVLTYNKLSKQIIANRRIKLDVDKTLQSQTLQKALKVVKVESFSMFKRDGFQGFDKSMTFLFEPFFSRLQFASTKFSSGYLHDERWLQRLERWVQDHQQFRAHP